MHTHPKRKGTDTKDIGEQAVLRDVVAEIHRIRQRWGRQTLPDGPQGSRVDAAAIRATAEVRLAEGTITWQDILAEEIAEALGEIDRSDELLYAELIQATAVLHEWATQIRGRIPDAGGRELGGTTLTGAAAELTSDYEASSPVAKAKPRRRIRRRARRRDR